MDQRLETVDAAREDVTGPVDAAHLSAQPLHVGEPIPAVCHIADMCRIFQISRTTFHNRRRQFEKFLLNGSEREWSGYRVAQHLRAGAASITVKRS